MNYKKVAVNFLPMIVLFLLVSYTKEFAKFSHTILGKLIAVIIILFYANLDKIAGLFVCILIIFYYQTDYIESFAPLYLKTLKPVETFATLKPNPKSKPESKIYKEETDIYSTSVNDAYSPIDENIVLCDKLQNEFRKTHCSNGHLLNKRQIVKPEMSEHIYPEIKQKSEFHKCNICDPSCDFSVMENKITVENDLMKPKSSNDMFSTVWENMRNSIGK